MGVFSAPPLEHIRTDDWAWVLTYTVWVSVLILGLGSEYVIGTIITSYLSIESLEIFWKGAAFTFPLFVTIALVSHSFWGLLPALRSSRKVPCPRPPGRPRRR